MIDHWDPVSREIIIGTQTFIASVEIPVGLARLRHVLMSGDLTAPGPPHIVTRIIVRLLVA